MDRQHRRRKQLGRADRGQGRSDGGYIGGIYTPKSVYRKFFMWLFRLLDPFIPTQIKFLATPLAVARPLFGPCGPKRPIGVEMVSSQMLPPPMTDRQTNGRTDETHNVDC